MLPTTRRILFFRRLFGGMSAKKNVFSSSSDGPFPVYTNPDSVNSQSRLPDSEFLKFDSKRVARIVTLDRPAALHALAYSMVNDLTSALRLWNGSDSAQVIVLQGGLIPSGKKSFCAGGDVVALCKSRGRTRDQCEFFRREFALNHLIATSNKPVVSILDGIVMGGGAGLSIHGQFRIATENTLFAMPETAIGYWPDVGASFFLPRLEGGLGYYLGITGARLKACDVYHAGLATHYIPSHRIPDVLESLSSSSEVSLKPVQINSILNKFTGDLQPYSLLPVQEAIDHAFLAPNLETILKRLRDLSSSSDNQIAKWAQETIQVMEKHSPTAMHTTLMLLQKGSTATIKTCLRNELNLAQNYVERADDLYSGIEAKLISKTGNPAWKPSQIDQVDHEFIKNLFAKSKDPITLNFYNDVDFEQYPHFHWSLPTSAQVKTLFTSKYRNLSDKKALIKALIADHFGLDKPGIQAHLERIVNKHVQTRAEMDKKGHVPTSNLNWQ